VALLGLVLAGCEKPDASHVTSPSARALIGTTTGNVAYGPADAAPEAVAAPEGWEFELDNVRFSELENGQHSLQVVSQLRTRPGPGMELWMSGPNATVFRWSGGSARAYDGVVCFQLRLEDEDSAVALDPAADYTFTLGFRDPGTGEIVVAEAITIAGRPPEMDRPSPGVESLVARDLLGCPRSVI
jgi:hypothetical protein